MGRNTALFKEIVTTLDAELDDPEYALDQLESHFHNALLMSVGDVNTVGEYARQLRSNITGDERSVALDYIGEKRMVMVTIETVDTAINELFVDRFIEP